MDFSPETMRARWKELTAEGQEIRDVLDPLRAELNSIVDGTADMTLAEAVAREPEVRSDIVRLQELLAPIENERGVIWRALAGKVED